jgi:hypothetical protein
MAFLGSTLANNSSAIRWQAGSNVQTAFGFVVQNGIWFQGSNDGINSDFGVRGDVADGSLGPIQFVVKKSGNVGVGTSTPSAKFEVAGTVKFAKQGDIPMGEFGLNGD